MPLTRETPPKRGLKKRGDQQGSLFFVLPALLLVLVALLLFLLLLLLLVATFLLLTLLVLLGTLIALLAHVGLRMPRAECRGRGDCVHGRVNVVWQFSNGCVKADDDGNVIPFALWICAILCGTGNEME